MNLFYYFLKRNNLERKYWKFRCFGAENGAKEIIHGLARLGLLWIGIPFYGVLCYISILWTIRDYFLHILLLSYLFPLLQSL